jgi:hypothetical protein
LLIPSPRDISNLVQRRKKAKLVDSQCVIADLQDAIQYCYDNSVHRLSKEQYDALAGNEM